MKKLPTPQASSDIDYLNRICSVAMWKIHFGLWKSAYGEYRRKKGNPWGIAPSKFVPDVSVAQRALYESRASSRWVADIRHAPLQSCPMCGSPVTGSVDHYLPKEDYPEFSLMAANLVPACVHCNSGVKGRTFKGQNPHERFIHPYFDVIADKALWYTKINPPFQAARFEAVPMPRLGGRMQARVRFHLNNVLGPQFHRSAENLWATLPQKIRDEAEVGPCMLTLKESEHIIRKALRDSIRTSGENSWSASFFRGVLADMQAIEYLRQRALPLSVNPLPTF